MKPLDIVIFEVVAHEIGHLLIDLIIEDEYKEYQIQSLNIYYYPKYNNREYNTYKVFSGSIKYQDKNIKRLEELVSEGKALKIKLTEISLLFGCFFQSQFTNTTFESLFSLNSFGRNDLLMFRQICELRNIRPSIYYNKEKFVKYFEKIINKLKTDMHYEIIEISKEIFQQYEQIKELNRIDKIGFSIEEKLEPLKDKIRSLNVYKELVDLVKNYSFVSERTEKL